MKILIILTHLVFGAVLVFIGFTYANRTLDLAFRSDFSPKSMERADIFSSPQAYINKCVELGGNTSQCEKEYGQIVKDIENNNKETTQYERDNLVSRLAPITLIFLMGVISILATIGFWKNKKWGAIGLIISTTGVLVLVLVWSIAILVGFGEILLLLMPLMAIGWLVLETLHIKRHWLEFN
ncbi:MAG: hypothetical protein AAB536_03190 [Patescibacteria group bacterium]